MSTFVYIYIKVPVPGSLHTYLEGALKDRQRVSALQHDLVIVLERCWEGFVGSIGLYGTFVLHNQFVK